MSDVPLYVCRPYLRRWPERVRVTNFKAVNSFRWDMGRQRQTDEQAIALACAFDEGWGRAYDYMVRLIGKAEWDAILARKEETP